MAKTTDDPEPTTEETLTEARNLLETTILVASTLYQHGYLSIAAARQLCLAAQAAADELASDTSPTDQATLDLEVIYRTADKLPC